MLYSWESEQLIKKYFEKQKRINEKCLISPKRLSTVTNTMTIITSIVMWSFPRLSLKKCPAAELWMRQNGDHWEFNKVEDGNIMKSTDQNHTFSYLEEPKGQTHRLEILLQAFLLLTELIAYNISVHWIVWDLNPSFA